MNTIEEVREFFKSDTFATNAGMVIDEIGDHYAKCSVPLDKRHKNAMGGVMGGVHFTLADFTFAVASNWQGERTVALNCDISYLATVKGKRLIAEANLMKNGRTTCVYLIKITDDLGTNVALIKATGYHVK
ncbi:MAG: PaaI family thioesterase [Ruminococcus sp.]|nr:PaaI family thioesterase [Ruminococcus sp.]